jgi:hypothetical protein
MSLWVHDGVFATEILYELERHTEFDTLIWESGYLFPLYFLLFLVAII